MTPEGVFWGKRHFYTHLAEKNNNQHTVLQNLDVVNQFGIKTDNLAVDISIPEDARVFVKKVFEKNGINKIKTTPYVPPLIRGEFKGVYFQRAMPKLSMSIRHQDGFSNAGKMNTWQRL